MAGIEQVRGWRMHDKGQLHFHLDKPTVRYFDSDEFIGREIVGGRFRETWTMHDPERDNKKILDEQNRVRLMHR